MNFLKKSLLLSTSLFMVTHGAWAMMDEENTSSHFPKTLSGVTEKEEEKFFVSLITAKSPDDVPPIGAKEQEFLKSDKSYLRAALWNYSYQGLSSVFEKVFKQTVNILTKEDIRSSFLMAAHGGNYTEENDKILTTILSCESLILPKTYFESVSRMLNGSSRFNPVNKLLQIRCRSLPDPKILKDGLPQRLFKATEEGSLENVNHIIQNSYAELSREVLENALYKAAAKSHKNIATYLLSDGVPLEIRPQILEVNVILLYAGLFGNEDMISFLMSKDLPIQPGPTCIKVIQELKRKN